MWINYNENPVANRVEDCAVRAVATALDVSWDSSNEIPQYYWRATT